MLLTTIALTKPAILKPFNKAWFWLGYSIGKIMNPIILGIIFFILITPISLLTKILKRDELRLKLIRPKTYWRIRDSFEVKIESFRNQF